MATTTIDLGTHRLTRVLYLEAAIDPEPTGLDAEAVRSVAWASPEWADDGQVRAASCVWVIEGGGRTVAVDPAGNLDEILHDPASTEVHQAAYVAAFDAAGVPIGSVDAVLLSHIESIGLTAVRDGDGWRRFFPNARVLISDTASTDFHRERPDGELGVAFAALWADGLVDTYADGDDVVPGVRAEWTGMHNPGHCALHVADGATFVGHLAVTPLHLATGPCPSQHADPEGAWRWLEAQKASGRILIGPLWPTPGALRWHPDGHPVPV
jgi:hypothetical protein